MYMTKNVTTFPIETTPLGYVEIDSGELLFVDGIWAGCLPSVVQERLLLNLGIEKCKVPVYGVTHAGNRYLVVSLDNFTSIPAIEGIVDVVDLPERIEEETHDET